MVLFKYNNLDVRRYNPDYDGILIPDRGTQSPGICAIFRATAPNGQGAIQARILGMVAVALQEVKGAKQFQCTPGSDGIVSNAATARIMAVYMPLAGKTNPDYDAAIPLLISRACEKFWLVSIELIARLERGNR